MKNILIKLTTIILVLGPIGAFATPIVSSFSQPSVSYGGYYSVGYRFSSDVDTSITALGYWDAYLNGFSASHEVGLWDTAGSLLGSVTLNAGTGDSLVGEFRYATLSQSITLHAGSDYYLAGTTLGDQWVYQASNIVMAPQFNYLGSYYAGSYGPAEFPAMRASSREYMTVSAMVAAPQLNNRSVAVTEPGSLALLAMGLFGMGALKSRKKI